MMLQHLMLLVTCTECKARSGVMHCHLSIMCLGGSNRVLSLTSLMLKSSYKGTRLGSSTGGLHMRRALQRRRGDSVCWRLSTSCCSIPVAMMRCLLMRRSCHIPVLANAERQHAQVSKQPSSGEITLIASSLVVCLSEYSCMFSKAKFLAYIVLRSQLTVRTPRRFADCSNKIFIIVCEVTVQTLSMQYGCMGSCQLGMGSPFSTDCKAACHVHKKLLAEYALACCCS